MVPVASPCDRSLTGANLSCSYFLFLKWNITKQLTKGHNPVIDFCGEKRHFKRITWEGSSCRSRWLIIDRSTPGGRQVITRGPIPTSSQCIHFLYGRFQMYDHTVLRLVVFRCSTINCTANVCSNVCCWAQVSLPTFPRVWLSVCDGKLFSLVFSWRIHNPHAVAFGREIIPPFGSVLPFPWY